MALLEKLSLWINRLLLGIAGIFLAGMILLTCANIFLRMVWLPLRGTFELMGYFGAVATAFALGYTQIQRGHIAVDIVVQRFSEKVQRVLRGVNGLLCMGFFGIASWRIGAYALNLQETGEVTETLRIIYYPFTWAVSFGCAALSLVFLVELLKSFLHKGDRAP